MKTRPLRVVLRGLLLLIWAVSMSHAQGRIVEPADIIILHGRVYTENPQLPWAQAVAIHRGKIVAVGDDPVIARKRGVGTRVIDAGGKLVLPGFVDCHIHFIDGSFSLGRVKLEGAKERSDIQKRLRQYAAEHPGDFTTPLPLHRPRNPGRFFGIRNTKEGFPYGMIFPLFTSPLRSSASTSRTPRNFII